METVPITLTHAQAARAIVCPLCWARQGVPCTLRTEPDGDHLTRYIEAYRHGAISADVMMAIFEATEVVTRYRMVPAELAAEAVTA